MTHLPSLAIAALVFGVAARSMPAEKVGRAAGAAAAVLDFEMEGRTGDSEDWSVGLSSFIEAELQSAGLPLVERRDIRMVLAERRLNESGVVRQRDLIQARLPSARFLVKGTIRPRREGEFVLTVSAVEIETGREIARMEGQGGYPADLVGEVRRLAAEMAQRLGLPLAPPPVREKLPGFTETPEIAFLFYRGAEHLMAGRPGLAAHSFDLAAKADPAFWVARLWESRAYESAGFPRIAQVPLRGLRESAQGSRFLDLVARGQTMTGRGGTVVAVLVSPGLSSEARRAVARLCDELREQQAVAIIEPSWLTSLGEELDLGLSGYFEAASEYRPVLWSMADVILRVAPPGDDEAAKPAEITLRDALSGNILARSVLPREEDSASEIAAVVADAERRAGTWAGAEADADVFRARAVHGVRGPARLDRLMVRVALGLDPLNDIMEMTGYYRRWWSYGIKETKGENPWYEEAAWKELLDRIDPEAEQAPLWYSTALWHLHRFRASHDEPIGDHFAPLISRYPGSLPALLCRYSIGMQQTEFGHRRQAKETIEAVADAFLEGLPRDTIPEDILGSVLIHAARACLDAGETESAARYVAEIERRLGHAPPDLVLLCRVGLWMLPYGGTEFVSWRCRMARREEARCLGREFLLLKSRLGEEVDIPDESVREPETLEDMAKRIEGLEIAGASLDDELCLRWEYIRRLLEESDGTGRIDPERADEALDMINYAMWTTWGREERDMIRAAAFEIARRGRLLDNPDFYLAIGDYPKVQEIAPGRWLQLECLTQGFRSYAEARYRRTFEGRNLDARNPEHREWGWGTFHACRRAGLIDEAAAILEWLLPVAREERGRWLEVYVHLADCERFRGRAFEASEWLRELAALTEGALLEEETALHRQALSELRKLRIDGSLPVPSYDWLLQNTYRWSRSGCSRFKYVHPLPVIFESEAQERLYDIVGCYWPCGDGSYPPWHLLDFYADEFGPDGLEELLDLLINGEGSWIHFAADPSEFVGKLAAPGNREAVLKAFRHVPQLAPTAFRIDPEGARRIVEECLPSSRANMRMPPLDLSLVFEHEIRSVYPVIFRAIADWGAVVAIDKVAERLRNETDESIRESFAIALAEHIEAQAWKGRDRVGLSSICMIGMEYGVLQAVHAYLNIAEGRWPMTKQHADLSPCIELPEDPAEAMALLRRHRDRLHWDPEARVFRVEPEALAEFEKTWTPPAEEEAEGDVLNLRLVQAVQVGDRDAVLRLLEAGAQITRARGANNEDLAAVAAQADQPDILRLFIERGLPVRGWSGYPAVKEAARFGSSDCIKVLIEHGAEIEPPDSLQSFAPLLHAIEGGHLGAVQVLLDHGASLSSLNIGLPPLCIAVSGKKHGIVNELLRRGAPVNQQDVMGFTPLHRAVNQGEVELAKLLMEHGADPMIRNNMGRTPADVAWGDAKGLFVDDEE